jgi:hypothetical protein
MFGVVTRWLSLAGLASNSVLSLAVLASNSPRPAGLHTPGAVGARTMCNEAKVGKLPGDRVPSSTHEPKSEVQLGLGIN